jgi:excisionase family DNA binding protein
MEAATQPRTIIQRIIEPILVSVDDAAQMIGRSRPFIYTCIGDGTLKAVKSNGRTLIVVESLHAYAAQLPPHKTREVPVRPPPRERPPPRRPRRIAPPNS